MPARRECDPRPGRLVGDRCEWCRARTGPWFVISSFASATDDRGGESADALDVDGDRVAGAQELRWLPGGPDALGCAGDDEVAGLERHHARGVGRDLGT